jgi:hypothetical protein
MGVMALLRHLRIIDACEIVSTTVVARGPGVDLIIGVVGLDRKYYEKICYKDEK